MSNKIKVGMIGAGQIAYNHCNGIQAHGEAEIAAVADLSKKRAKELAEAFNINKVTTKWEDLIADPELDAVAIALPNFLHAPVSIAALKAGKHVLLDKPFAMNMQEARQVDRAATKSGKVMMVGMNQRYRAESQTLRVLAERGELGEIYHGKAYWLRRTGCPTFGTWFGNKKLAGGGALLDIGVHMLDLCLWLMDGWDPNAVSGQVYTKFGNRGMGEGSWGKSDKSKKAIFDVDDFANAIIKFDSGATVELNVSWALHMAEANQNNVELFGTEAGACTYPTTKLYRYGKKDGEYEVVEPQNVKIPMPHCNRHVNWLDAILGKDKPLSTVKEALVVQSILDAIYKSSETGKEVRIRKTAR